MMKAKTTKEISEEYNHKAPDSLLCGGELWVSLDELRKELVHLFLFRKDCSKVCWTDFLDELFSSPSPLVACKKPLTKAKEGRAKERLIPKKLGGGAIPPSLALPKCQVCGEKATHINVPNPYTKEINDIIVLGNWCDEHYHNLSMDI